MSIQLASVKEDQTAVIQAIIQNEFHQVIDATNLLWLRCTITNQNDDFPYPIINGRDHQDIWGVNPIRVNGGMVFATLQTGPNGNQYNLDLRLDPLDNPITDETLDSENHLVLLEWSWMDTGVQKYGAEELILPVENLREVGPQ